MKDDKAGNNLVDANQQINQIEQQQSEVGGMQMIYKEVKAYFEPYKNNEFILNLGEYVDSERKDVSGSVVYPLMMYGLFKINKILFVVLNI